MCLSARHMPYSQPQLTTNKAARTAETAASHPCALHHVSPTHLCLPPGPPPSDPMLLSVSPEPACSKSSADPGCCCCCWSCWESAAGCTPLAAASVSPAPAAAVAAGAAAVAAAAIRDRSRTRGLASAAAPPLLPCFPAAVGCDVPSASPAASAAVAAAASAAAPSISLSFLQELTDRRGLPPLLVVVPSPGPPRRMRGLLHKALSSGNSLRGVAGRCCSSCDRARLWAWRAALQQAGRQGGTPEGMAS
jgi:hypothetical protein